MSYWKSHQCHPVFYTREDYENFYVNFCNGTLWPILHSLPNYASFHAEAWAAYQRVNELFAEEISLLLREDDVIWIHDFHLMLLPELLRRKFPRIKIGFFLHIPFPPFEIFRILSDKHRRAVLNGLLGADLLGFHTHDYASDFLRTIVKTLRYDYKDNIIVIADRIVKADTFPMGINFAAFNERAASEENTIKKSQLAKYFPDQKLILSIDRLDYTKGIEKRLLAYESFLRENPHWLGKVSMILVLVPSRESVVSYQKLKEQIDVLVGRINGAMSRDNWTPIFYQYTQKSFNDLVALYSLADIALITPLRDGMNLTAKEYIASRVEENGVLILSEMAGASHELLDARMVNPFHTEEIAAAIKDSLEVSEINNVKAVSRMRRQVQQYDIFKWSADFLASLDAVSQENLKLCATSVVDTRVVNVLNNGGKRLLVLDYDGTLVPFEKYPHLAAPSPFLVNILRALCDDPNTNVLICTGRDRATLDDWLAGLDLTIIAENGGWIKQNGEWRLTNPTVSGEWKKELTQVLSEYIQKLPGSFLEEKEFALVWHFRNAEHTLSELRKKDLILRVQPALEKFDLELSNEIQSVEIKCKGISKEWAFTRLINLTEYDIIAAFGDDVRDERLFAVLPPDAITFKVGLGQTIAKYRLANPNVTQEFLSQLVGGHSTETSGVGRFWQDTTLINNK